MTLTRIRRLWYRLTGQLDPASLETVEIEIADDDRPKSMLEAIRNPYAGPPEWDDDDGASLTSAAHPLRHWWNV